MSRCLLLPALAWLALAGPAAADDVPYEEALASVLARSFPEEFGEGLTGPPPADRWLFVDALSSDVFLHEAVGPFDLYVYKADGLASKTASRDTLRAAADGLAPLVPMMEQRFGRAQGVISGRRFPVVLGRSSVQAGQTGFDSLIALLDWCETDWTGWTADNGTLWTEALRRSQLVRTWDVLLINLDHPAALEQGQLFLQHGIGYQVLTHLVHRLLRLGSWGLVPPWLDHGLVDELDIEAYGEAWVGGDWHVVETEGWFRPGWSGFVPEGSSPPPPVTGPPADLATTVRNTGDSWAHRDFSGTRHWSNLAADLGAEYPPSFRFMAEQQSFLPRDRAYARCVLHLLLAWPPARGTGLVEHLDRLGQRMPNGMFTSDPLTEIVAASLGGVAAVDAMSAQPVGEKLAAIGHRRELDRITAYGGQEALALSDHREQGQWLYEQAGIGAEARGILFEAFLAAEHHEQLAAWELLGEALDRGAHAALASTPHYPVSASDRELVGKAFLRALAEAP